MQSGMVRLLILIIAFVSAVLAADVAVVARAPSPVSVEQVFAKHGVSWGHLMNYEGRYTVQGILHRFFPHDDGRRVLDELGFQRGVVPTDTMLDSLQRAVESDPKIIDVKEYQEPLRRLTISAQAERVLSEIDEVVVATDESLSYGQKAMLKSALALRKSYVATSPVTIDNAIEAIKKGDRLTLAGMLDSGKLDPNLPIVSGMPLLGFAARMLAIREGEIATANSLVTATHSKKRVIQEKLDSSIDQLNWLVDHPRVDLNATDEQGRTFIGMATRQGSFEALKIALSKGMDVNSVDWLGNSPLLTHIIYGSVGGGSWMERVKFLVEEHNARIDIINNNGTTALHAVVAIEAKGEGTELTEYFLARGADVNASRSGSGRKPLDIATAGNNLDLIALLLKHGAEGAMYPRGVRRQ